MPEPFSQLPPEVTGGSPEQNERKTFYLDGTITFIGTASGLSDVTIIPYQGKPPRKYGLRDEAIDNHNTGRYTVTVPSSETSGKEINDTIQISGILAEPRNGKFITEEALRILNGGESKASEAA